MRISTSKSKNAESFYITKGYINNEGKSTSVIIRKLGTLKELLKEHGPTRDDVMTWAREEARLETLKYKQDQEERLVQISFRADRQLDFDKQVFCEGGYLFLQSIYYQLRLDRVCRKIRDKGSFRYDINAILSDLIYTRILDPSSKRSSYEAACRFLEAPTYQLHDVYRALSVLATNSDLIQVEVFKNSQYLIKRNDRVLYYDCTNYYFEIDREDGPRRYGRSKEHRPNPIVQMGLFVDGDGIPLAFSLFPGNQNEQASLKPLEEKILQDFGHQKFIYCSDAGLASEPIRAYNHTGERAFIVTQSIKKLKAQDRERALDRSGFRSVSTGRPVDQEQLSDTDKGKLFYKEIPYTTPNLHQRLIITYSPKYAAYQKQVRVGQIERAQKMLASGKCSKRRKSPNDPARFIGEEAITRDGKKADIHYYLDEQKIAEEERYDGFYAVCTDLMDEPVSDILKVSEGRWQIEQCFRNMKTDFSARPVYVSREDRIRAHFLTCFLALLVYRVLEAKLGRKYTCDEILTKLREMNFADVEEQGYIPLYTRSALTDELHKIGNFRTDYHFITKSKMKEIQKKSKGR